MKLILFILLINLFSFHPIHLSVANIDYNFKTKKLEISFRVFADDFEQIINSKNDVVLNIGKKNEHKKTNNYIDSYISEHFSLTINNTKIKSKKLVLKKRELKDITIWLYYSIDFSGGIKQIKIMNSILTDLYRDQKNLLIFTYKNKQTPLQFNSKNTIKTIKF